MPLPLPPLIRLLLRALPPMRLPVQRLLRSRNTLRSWLISQARAGCHQARSSGLCLF
jgi:hypothetical protein